MPERDLRLIVILSLGRSGSTFLASAISDVSEFVNIGENRYFWRQLAKKPQHTHATAIARYLSRKEPTARCFIDKTPDLYQVIDQIDLSGYNVKIIELVRDSEAIQESRRKFVSTLRNPTRIWMRICKYYGDYGIRWFIPILQRWYLILPVLGIESRRAFVSGGNVGDPQKERAEFNLKISSLRQKFRIVTINYDQFADSVQGLSAFGFSEAQIAEINAKFRR